MPIAFSKDATVKFCLKADEDRPENERVYFLCRYLTCRQRDQWYEKIVLANKTETSDADTTRLLNEALALGVIGPVGAKLPDGSEVPCTLGGIDMVLTYSEKFELAHEYVRAISLDEQDKKKSTRRSSSNGLEPAGDTPPANAATAPPQPPDSARVA